MGGSCQCIDGDKTESRRTIKNDVVIDAVVWIKECLQHPFPVEHHLKLQINTCHVETAGDYIEVVSDWIDGEIGLFPDGMVYYPGWYALHEVTGKVCLGV